MLSSREELLMSVELRIPRSGESITEVQVGEWRKSEGDWVDRDEALVERETDKASMDLPAPVSGTLSRVLKQSGQMAEVGEVIGLIEEGGPPPAAEREADVRPEEKGQRGRAAVAPERKAPPPAAEAGKGPAALPAIVSGSGRPTAETGSGGDGARPKEAAARGDRAADQEGPPPGIHTDDRGTVVRDTEPSQTADAESAEQASGPRIEVRPRVMPSARRALSEYGLTAADVEGTGPGGRVLKEDVLRHVERIRAKTQAQAPSEAPRIPDRPEEAVPMSMLRRRIAERLVQAQQNAALLTTFNEVDMTAVMQLRRQHQEAFQKRHGVKLGFMSFFVKATIDALGRFPELNAQIRGNEIVYHRYYDIGVAVGTDKGLVVPVLRDAEKMSFAEVEKAIADLGSRAREKKLKIEELQGGTFTISNGGVYGSLLSTPIVNPPQSGILGLHAIQERPVVRDGQVVARPMMYLALTYDHRIVDGREAVTFLKHIRDVVEDPARMLIDV
jgi:2-oxoglutarate dehydrogenase E2 component (dihydrolipoamide succinyltransferase)